MTVAILPMKPPGLGKTRLAGEFDPSFRSALAAAMYADVLTALARSALVERTVVVTSDFECARIAMLHGAQALDDPDLDGHSSAASLGAQAAAESGAERVLLVPGDCPGLDPAEVDDLLAQPQSQPGCSVIPDRHGTGTNALLIAPPLALSPSFGPGSHRRHLELAADAGIESGTVNVPSLAFDVDTPEDLQALIAHLDAVRGTAAHTRGFLSQTGWMTALA